MKNILLCFCLLVSLTSCKKDADIVPGEVLIRVTNGSTYQLESVYVNTSGGENNYGLLRAGQSSAYKAFKTAYRYANVKAVVEGEELAMTPYDYVGETPLKPGYYSYMLGVTTTNNGKQLSLQLEKP